MKIYLYFFCGFLLFIFFTVGYIIYINSDFRIAYKKEIQNGNKLIELILEYETEKGKLPEKKSDFIPKNEIQKYEIYCYEFHESYYILFFGTTLGEGVYYNSRYREWNDVDIP